MLANRKVERMSITKVTRRALVADLMVGSFMWWGALEEPDFLGRLYPLEQLPSHDGRFPHALDDLIQHRINNYDWDDDWVFRDDRLGLAGDDDATLLRFLAETLHPEVRSDQAEIQALLVVYNKHLRRDGWELYHQRLISGRPSLHGGLPRYPPSLAARFVRRSLKRSGITSDRTTWPSSATRS